jgi:ATP-dependent Clp protease ATP-binding subunit ClpA
MFERFTTAARAAISDAVSTAQELGAERVQGTHVLLALARDTTGSGGRMLRDAGGSPHAVRSSIEADQRLLGDEDVAALRELGIDVEVVLARMRESFGADAVRPRSPRRLRTRVAPPVKRALELAVRQAVRSGARSIGTEHLLLGLLDCDDPDVPRTLVAVGVDPGALRAAVLRSLGRAA